MRDITPALVETLVRHFSHGAGTHYDPTREIGTQREGRGGLGFGSLYMSMADILDARNILVVGSGRGFAVACFAVAVEDRTDARVRLVDPGFSTWSVDGGVTDSAPGLWKAPAQGEEYFREHLGLTNITCDNRTSDEAFADFRKSGTTFDVILIDGEHGFEQASRDFENALSCLAVRGMIFAHDTACPQWPGVVLGVRDFAARHPDLQLLTLPLYPGLSLLQRDAWPLEIRLATVTENEQVNAWRAEAGVTLRPLPGGDDPRPGSPCGDAREGLYAVLEHGRLIGGFGIRRRTFSGGGNDDFPPASGKPITGFLRYGTVLAPDARGRGRWKLVTAAVASWFADEGFYTITTYKKQARNAPYEVAVAGHVGPFTAYHVAMRQGPNRIGSGMDVARLFKENADLRVALEHARKESAALRSSLIWRMTGPVRAVLDRLRGASATRSS